MKLIVCKTEDTPVKQSKNKMVRSTYAAVCARLQANSGYTVQLVPVLASTINDARNGRNDGGSNQKLMLFICGNAISAALIIRGTNQFPKPRLSLALL